MATFPKITGPLLALAAAAIALPAAAQEAPPSQGTKGPTRDTPTPQIYIGEVFIADQRKPTVVELAKLRWDETHRRLDSAKARRDKD